MYFIWKSGHYAFTAPYNIVQRDRSRPIFFAKKDSAFVKMNGQIIEALDYKGNNSFEGGLGRIKAQFEIIGDAGVRVKIKIMTGPDKYVSVEGNKIHKYQG